MLKRLLNSMSSAISEVMHAAPDPATPGPYLDLLDAIEDSESPAGIDLAYEDEYAAIQDEIAKRGDIDDSVIQGNAALLLRTRGKDLRAAVFLAYSTLRVDGLASCMAALALTQRLIDRFGADVHPRKPPARRAALEWLCNERFVDPLTLQAKAADEEALQTLQATVAALANSTQAWPEQARPDFSGLTQRITQWLDERSHQQLRLAVSHNAQAEPTLPPMLGAGQGSDLASTAPKSAQEAWLLIRKASAVLRSDSQWTEAGRACLREARWASVVEMPPQQGGVTRFAAPRKEARAYLANLHGDAQWPALLDECSRLFNEASNHLWLDLLHWADAAYAQMGTAFELSRARLALDLRALLARLPQLPALKFDDGSAFAAPSTKEWLDGLIKPAPEPPKAPESRARDDVLARARLALKAQGVAAALGVLQAQAQASACAQRRFELQGQMLELARDAGRRDLALGLARQRATQVDAFSLDRWSPELAFDVLAELHALLRASGEPGLAEARALHGRLCGLDAARAADLQ